MPIKVSNYFELLRAFGSEVDSFAFNSFKSLFSDSSHSAL